MTQWVAQIVHQLRRWLGPDQEITMMADSAFCARLICRACRKRRITFVSRLRLDARLFQFPESKSGPQRGRPRLVGDRLPNMIDIAMDSKTEWRALEVGWYGGGKKALDFISGTALWYGYGEPPEPIHWIVTRDCNNSNELVGLMCTALEWSPEDVVEAFVGRWAIETTFQELRAHLGFETVRTWAKKGIERVSPTIIASYSLICLMAKSASLNAKDPIRPYQTAWYPKDHVTFSDVIFYIRLLIHNEQYFPRSSKTTTLRKSELEEILRRMAVG